LAIDRLTAEREGVVAHTTAQSAAMEYYEEIVDGMFAETQTIVDRLEESGTVSLRTRPLHRFIGRAVGIRNEVLAVLHLLDKPDATWDDPEMDRIYGDLRLEFDLEDPSPRSRPSCAAFRRLSSWCSTWLAIVGWCCSTPRFSH